MTSDGVAEVRLAAGGLHATKRPLLDLTTTERIADDALADVHTLNENEAALPDDFANILDGTARADFSHAGEDFASRLDMDEDELMEDLRASHQYVFTARAIHRPFLTFYCL